MTFLEKDPRIQMYTISNGVCIGDSFLDFLWEHRKALEFCISLDGYAALHDMNRVGRDGNGTFVAVMDTIRRYEERFGCKPSVNCTITPQHLAHSEELIQFFTESGFKKVTFSKLFDANETVSGEEFVDFLKKASATLEIRQLRKTQTYDCAQYGVLCGVGRTNVYFASGKIYPCGRFAGLEKYCLGTVKDPLNEVDTRLNEITPCDNGRCYYDQFVKIGGIQ